MAQFGAQKGKEPKHAAAPEELLVPVNYVQVQSSFLQKAKLLWANRKFLRTALLVGFIVGVAISLLIPPLYVSSIQLMPPDSRSAAGPAMLAALMARANSGIGAMAGDLLGGQTTGALFVGILRSRTLQDRIVDRFQLKKVYGVKLSEDARKELAENTGISEDHKSGIITVAVTDHDPKRAAAISSAYAQELNRLSAELSTSSARRERIFLEERLHEVKRDLDSAAAKFSDFASKNTAIDIPAQGKAMVEAAAKLQGELMVADSELRGLQAIYTDQNVRVRSLRARVSELQSQLQKLGGDASLSTDPMSKQSNAMYPSIRKLPILGVTYADLYRNTKIQETVFELLTQQYELAKVQEAKEIPSVRLLDDADLPQRRSFPPRTMMTLMVMLIALFLASLWILTKDRWDRTDIDDPGKLFVREMFHTVNSVMPWSPPNGSRWHTATNQIWTRVMRKNRDSNSQNLLDK